MIIGIFNLDKVQDILERAQHPVAVMTLGNGDVEVFDIPIPPNMQADIAARGFECIALAGIVDGVPQIEMPQALSVDEAFAIGAAHMRHIEMRMRTPTLDA